MILMTSQRVEKYRRALRASEITRGRVQALFDANQLAKRDLETLYEGLFLKAVVGFESLLEEVFFDVLNGKSSNSKWRPKFAGGRQDLRKCVYGKQKYLDWLPIDNTLNRAELFLKRGLPFSRLTADEATDDRGKLTKIVLIRNAIAHQSDFSMEKFRKSVIANTPLPVSEKRPAGFLCGRSTAALTRYEIYARALGGISGYLC